VSASRRGRICICGGGKGGRPLQLFEEILVHAVQRKEKGRGINPAVQRVLEVIRQGSLLTAAVVQG